MTTPPSAPATVRIDVPATSAGLGTAYESLAVALDIVDSITAVFGADEGSSSLKTNACPDPRDALLREAYRAWGAERGVPLPEVDFTPEWRIPTRRGLGSRAAAIVAGLVAAAHASGQKHSGEALLQIAARLNARPANAAAALLGGFTTILPLENGIHPLHVVNHFSLGIALFVPEDARSPDMDAATPLAASTDDASSAARACYLVTSLLWGRWEHIGIAMQGIRYSPHVIGAYPALESVLEAALGAGAYGAALCGLGPAIIALSPRVNAPAVVEAMRDIGRLQGWLGTGMVVDINHRGAHLTQPEPA